MCVVLNKFRISIFIALRFYFSMKKLCHRTLCYKLQQKVQTFRLSKLVDKIKLKQIQLKELRLQEN